MNIKLNWKEYEEREKKEGLEGQLLYTLKHSTKWEERDGAEVLCDFDWSLFCFVTGLDKCEGCFNEVHYCKEEDGLYRLYFLYFVEGDVVYNAYFEFSGDVLHPYSEYGGMTVENFFNDNMTSVIQRLKDYAPDVVDEIEDRFFRSLTVSDLTEPLYWEVVTDYLQKQIDMHKD